jgi:sugar phosphate isomerase/epimerase
MFGVSPAYFISRFTDRFTCRNIADALPDLRSSGFQAFQPEVFRTDTLDDWRTEGSLRIRRSADASGMQASQFVAHFLLHAFESPAALASDFGIVETEKALEGMARFPECAVLTVAMPPFCPTEATDLTGRAYLSFRSRLVDKLGRMLEITERANRRMALEIIPGSMVGGVQGFLRLYDELGSEALGYNFDTGLAWCAHECVALIPAQLGRRIFGTHLKDNLKNELALAPGKGSIDWPQTLAALKASGYAGSLDIEFRCQPDQAMQEYEEALGYLKPLVH